MKKLLSLLAVVCLTVCFCSVVFADDTADSSASQPTTSETAQIGDDLTSAAGDSVDNLQNLINGVQEKWDDVFGGLNGVLEFFTVCVAASISCLPTGYGVYLLLLCICISVVAIIREMGRK